MVEASRGGEAGRSAGERYTGLDVAEEDSGFDGMTVGKARTGKKKGNKTDPTQALIPDPESIPADKQDAAKRGIGKPWPMTAWRTDKLRDMTYTQFWKATGQGFVDYVEYTPDRRSMLVHLKDDTPGGARTERVGLPYDPELFEHLMVNGVEIRDHELNVWDTALFSIVRLMFPIVFSMWLIKFSFRLGRKRKRDRIFGGARLELVSRSDTTFADVAGIEQVKQEIMEIVRFLQNPKLFLKYGARSPAGILMVGPPGTGKTLLAKAIAGEARVPFLSVAGTEFSEMFVGVGAARVRDMFARARKMAPCILFIDEFDGLGQQRSYNATGSDESVTTINQLLTEMDGFDDNTGVVVLAATNRPASLDEALTRPGRFDRLVHLPLPNAKGRTEILKVHARGKSLAGDLDLDRFARATAGFTGAELMNLMNQSAILAVRQGNGIIDDTVMFEALEKIQIEKYAMKGGSSTSNFETEAVSKLTRRHVAVYEAGKALIAYITPGYDEVSKISVCPGGEPTGHTYMIPQEERLELNIYTRGFLESQLAVLLAGRCAERLLLGDDFMSLRGGGDVEKANIVAREMVFRYGFNKRLGPMILMDNEERYLANDVSRAVLPVSAALARAGLQDITETMEGAEAKALYGLCTNWKALEALVTACTEREALTGKEITDVLEGAGVKRFPDDRLDGFGFDAEGNAVWPGKDSGTSEDAAVAELMKAAMPAAPKAGMAGQPGTLKAHPLNQYAVRSDSGILVDQERLLRQMRPLAGINGDGAGLNGDEN
ncbi:unnamed protein product [Pedinophyceae sp. YPF-701]|nr:unnamed protein product [Pedinophyceae sp. YPF-701]